MTSLSNLGLGYRPQLDDINHFPDPLLDVPATELWRHLRGPSLFRITTATRSEALPDLPTVGDFVPGYEASAVNGIGAPASSTRRASSGDSTRRLAALHDVARPSDR